MSTFVCKDNIQSAPFKAKALFAIFQNIGKDKNLKTLGIILRQFINEVQIPEASLFAHIISMLYRF